MSSGYTTIEALEAALPAALYQRESLPWGAAFLAGKCFLLYRRRGVRIPAHRLQDHLAAVLAPFERIRRADCIGFIPYQNRGKSLQRNRI